MKFWLTRDKGENDTKGTVCLHTLEPYLYDNETWNCDGQMIILGSSCFPELTFTNSPKVVELKL